MGREGTNKTPHPLTEQPAMRPISRWNALSGKEEIRFNHIICFCSKKKKPFCYKYFMCRQIFLKVTNMKSIKKKIKTAIDFTAWK